MSDEQTVRIILTAIGVGMVSLLVERLKPWWKKIEDRSRAKSEAIIAECERRGAARAKLSDS